MKAVGLLLAFLFFACAGFSNAPVRAEIAPSDSITLKKLLKEIAKVNVFITSENLNDDPFLVALKKEATPFDLVKISMENENAVVRLYAFELLSERMDNLPAELVMKFKQDTTLISVRTNNITRKFPVHQVANGFLK